MSMYIPMGWLVKYENHHEDGSITSFHAGEFKHKWQAKLYVWKKKRHASPGEKWEIIDCTWK